ncbi:hypothetical protein EJB05_04461, partial [Eragrostis curvula]
MLKRRRLDDDSFDDGAPSKPLLYLVFDDWARGYSIRMVDLPYDDDDDDSAGLQRRPLAAELLLSGGRRTDATKQAPQHPPVFIRIEAPRGMPRHVAPAFGTKILFMHPNVIDGKPLPSWAPKRHVSVLDVRGPYFRYGPRHVAPAGGLADPIYIPVSDELLFALAAVGSFELLHPPAPAPEPDIGSVWSWHKLSAPPFEAKSVTAYAVHPDGRTLFVSVEKDASVAPFTFDATDEYEIMLGGGGVWRRHGEWALPFTGRAYFDRELDAWVGLSRDPDSTGHICSCNAVPADSDDGDGQFFRARKLSKEKLFSEDPVQRHVGATLVYMGGKSNFCLVECISVYEKNDSYAEEKNDGCVDEMEYTDDETD